ncbi:thioredoxin domain-containing protein [Candidatus Acetothermia bacterium]|nr:thioredoxin domain-containing protein [Candidatus Acetothermia bacterium]
MGKKTNYLIHETSPYLLQHAYNPVGWYPWGKEALAKAKVEDKPILLSIGYSACHWCHVMEHESFENETIARFMNEHFVNIKVDREERPDLDEVYMTAVQLMTGQGGWPMTVFLTPDLKPFFGGTYFPPEDRPGLPGFLTVLHSIAEVYKNERSAVVEQAERLKQHLQKIATGPSGESLSLLTQDLLQRAYTSALEIFDREQGGFGRAPKFPHSMELSLLLRYWRRTHDPDALHIVELTLEKMARGGMYDQLGGGFHRYSTDARWLIPHFEKMLYDNALLVWIYLEAYQATHKPFYRRIVEETLEYVLREMTSSEGGFYATQDADSPGGEGAFFSWIPQEPKAVLGEKEGALICEYFGVTEAGNFEHGKSVLHLPYALEEFSTRSNLSATELEALIKHAKAALFQAREQREKPGRDEKILTAWNGLMISSFARASQILEDKRYLEAAENAARFCLKSLNKDGKLLRSYKDGQAKFNAYLEDYACLITGFLDLYEASFELEWLKEAQALSKVIVEKFWDESNGGFFFTSKDHEMLVARSKSAYDGATPSGNSAAVLALLRLAELTSDSDLRKKTEQTLRLFRDLMEQAPNGFSHMLCALDFYLGPTQQIAIVGDKSDSRTQKLLSTIHQQWLPNKVLALKESRRSVPELENAVPLLKDKTLKSDIPTVYVCENYACKTPVTDPQDLEKLLC